MTEAAEHCYGKYEGGGVGEIGSDDSGIDRKIEKGNEEPQQNKEEGKERQKEGEESLGSSTGTKKERFKEIIVMKRKDKEMRGLQMDMNLEDRRLMRKPGKKLWPICGA